jgi:hypothetical protein
MSLPATRGLDQIAAAQSAHENGPVDSTRMERFATS